MAASFRVCIRAAGSLSVPMSATRSWLRWKLPGPSSNDSRNSGSARTRQKVSLNETDCPLGLSPQAGGRELMIAPDYQSRHLCLSHSHNEEGDVVVLRSAV